jgi:DNA polymerase
MAVPGEGDPAAKILFIGEAPGEKEDLSGRPFCGRTGPFLDKLLEGAGISRETIFITSSVKCRPPKNRTPHKKEMTICRDAWLLQQIELIDPKLLVVMGKAAQWCIFQEDVKLADVHGRVRDFQGRKAMTTFHPTAAMRFKKLAEQMREDLALIKGLA